MAPSWVGLVPLLESWGVCFSSSFSATSDTGVVGSLQRGRGPHQNRWGWHPGPAWASSLQTREKCISVVFGQPGLWRRCHGSPSCLRRQAEEQSLFRGT